MYMYDVCQPLIKSFMVSIRIIFNGALKKKNGVQFESELSKLRF